MAEVGAVKAACDAVVEHLYGSRAVQVLLATAREPCKCCSRAVQVSHKWNASVAHEGCKRGIFMVHVSQQNAHNKQVTVKRYLDKP